MTLPFKPFGIDYHKDSKKWLVSQKVGLIYGTDFYIVCDSKENAQEIATKLNEQNIKKPTVDSSLYEKSSEFTPSPSPQNGAPDIKFWRVKKMD